MKVADIKAAKGDPIAQVPTEMVVAHVQRATGQNLMDVLHRQAVAKGDKRDRLVLTLCWQAKLDTRGLREKAGDRAGTAA